MTRPWINDDYDSYLKPPTDAAQNDQIPEFEFLECVPFDGIIIN